MQASPARAAKRRTPSTRWAITSLHSSTPWDYLRSMCSALHRRLRCAEFRASSPPLVRRLVLAGTGPRNGEPRKNPRVSEVAANPVPMCEDFLFLFFSPSEAGQAAGRAFWGRRHQRKNADPPSSPETMKAQQEATMEWREPRGKRYSDLKTIKQPTLVVNGNDDIMVPTINSFTVSQHVPNAQLILYPDSGHGALFQYPELFVAHTK